MSEFMDGRFEKLAQYIRFFKPEGRYNTSDPGLVGEPHNTKTLNFSFCMADMFMGEPKSNMPFRSDCMQILYQFIGMVTISFLE